MPVVQPMVPAAGLRPPVPGMFQQNARAPVMGSSPANQLSNGEQNSADTNFHESAETEKNVLCSLFPLYVKLFVNPIVLYLPGPLLDGVFLGSLEISEGKFSNFFQVKIKLQNVLD